MIRVLQIEDSQSDAALMVRLLERAGYEVAWKRVENASGMRDALTCKTWDVIIADHGMAQFDAPGALRVLHETGLDIPFVVVSGAIGEDLAVALMKAGAHDYLLKDNLTRLAPAVDREIREARIRRERRESEAALRKSEERLSLALSATQLGIFDYDLRNGQVIWSEQVKRQFGLPPNAEVTNDTFLQGIHPDDRQAVDRIVQDALLDRYNGQLSAEFRTVGIEDGIERCLSASGRVFFGADGPAIRMVGVMLEITDRKRLEDQFRQAQKLESVGRLAGGIAHDFNNLLTVITGYSQMMLEELSVHHPMRDRMEEISKAATRASALTRQLLAFSRRQVTELKTIAINDIVRDTERMLRRLIGEDIQVVLSLSTESGVFRADPGQIEQVLMNLAVNARDAMPSGGRLLIETASLHADEEFSRNHLSVPPGRYAVLSVSDTGVGMSQEVKARLFEPFFTTKEAGKGTGLGLSTVYGIVKQSGGSIWVYSEPGQGSSFKLLFPAVASEVENSLPTPAEPARSGNETILVVEDESRVRKYIRDVLEHHGYSVVEAANGGDALDIVREHAGPIHLLLSDAVMPSMGGAELASRFTSLRPGIPVLCMSGYSDRLLPEVASGQEYIQKPFTPSALLAQVRWLLDLPQDGAK